MHFILLCCRLRDIKHTIRFIILYKMKIHFKPYLPVSILLQPVFVHLRMYYPFKNLNLHLYQRFWYSLIHILSLYQITQKLKILVFIKSCMQPINTAGSTILSPPFCAKFSCTQSSIYFALNIGHRWVLQ